MDKTKNFALVGLVISIAYAAYHMICGVENCSWWFLTLGVYYAILSIMRFVVLVHKGNARALLRFTGIMLMLLSLSLVGTVILALVQDRGKAFHLIVMLAIAVYSFTMITLATINWIKSRKIASAKLVALRNIAFADALVAIFSLQRSMLVSFAGMTEAGIRIMNAATGCGVCIAVFLLGYHLVKKTPYDF